MFDYNHKYIFNVPLHFFFLSVYNHLFAPLYQIILLNYQYFSNRSFWLVYGTLTGTTTLGQSGTRSNGNDGVLYTLQNWIFTTRCSLVSYSGHPSVGVPLCRGYSQCILSPAYRFFFKKSYFKRSRYQLIVVPLSKKKKKYIYIYIYIYIL